MPSRSLVMTLAKLMTAAAWSDGIMDPNEINSLKDLLFKLPRMTEDEWTVMNMYIEIPVTEDDINVLLEDLVDSIHTDEDKEFVLSAMTGIVEADGETNEVEQKFLEGINEAISKKETGLLTSLAGFMKTAVDKRCAAYNSGIQREEKIEDYLKNTIYFQLMNALNSSGLYFDLSDEIIRKMCIASGLMARVALVDGKISRADKKIMKKVISEIWMIPLENAQLVTDISCSSATKGLDYFRLTRMFYEVTNVEERKTFLKSLFMIANSSNKTGHAEIEEIRTISEDLLLHHKDFIEAKLSIPDSDRGGL